MANEKIKLPKPTGSGSDGNINVPGGSRVLDLGDFDDIFGPMESQAPKQGPLGQFYTGFKDSLGDRLKTKDIVRNFLRSAAPDGISNAIGFAREMGSASRDIAESLERTNASDLQYVARRARELLPKLQGKGYDDTLNKISDTLENKIDEYDYTINSQKDQTAIRRARQQVSEDTLIKEALDNISLTERLNHNRSEQSANYRHNQNRSENAIRDVLRTKRFDFTAKAMGQTVDGINRLVGYNEQVNYSFQRKGLELQFRTYMGIKELVKLNEAQIELNVRAYNAMIRNTGLTDHAKSKTPGLMGMDSGRDNRGFMSKLVGKAMPRTLSNFLGGYGQEVQGRVGSNISQKLSNLVMAARMGENTPDLWGNRYNIAGQLAGEYAGDFVLNDIIPSLGRAARPGLTKLSNRHGGRHNQMGYYLDNLPAFMQEFVNNGQNQHGFKGTIRDMLAPFVPQFGLQDRLKDGTYQTIDQPAQFNQATQRTIVDGLTGYQARILQELRMIRTGDTDVKREVFDLTTGKFVVQSVANDGLLNKIVPKSAIRVASSTINDALNTMDADGQLSPEARKALSERLLRDASINKRFDPEAYIRGRGYANGTSPEVAAELERFFRTKFEFDESNKMADTSNNQQLRQEFSQVFLDIRSVSRDPVKEINRLISSGHTEPLRAMGIIINEDGMDKINYNRIWEILRSDVTGNNPWAPGGSGFDPNRVDNSGTAGHREFMGPTHPGMIKAYGMAKAKGLRRKYAPEEQAARDQMARHLKAMRGRYGATSNKISGMMEAGPLSYSGVLDARMPNMYNSGMAAYDKFVGNLPGHEEKAKGYVTEGMEKLTDLYSQFDPTQPLIKGIDFSMGNLIDVNTKKIITSPKDITGEVINNLGQTVVTATEAAAGLLTPAGDIAVKAIEQVGRKVSDAIEKHQARFGFGSSKADDTNTDENLNKQDWSLGPGEQVVIAARKLMNGEYRDAAGRVIDSISDIAGDVYDASGNLVLSAKEFADGLWSKRTGKRWRPTKNFSKVLNAIKAGARFSGGNVKTLAFNTLKFAAGTAVGLASKAFNFMVENQNAYLDDNPVPVLTRRALKNGDYFDSKGKPIEDFNDVYSIIYDARGEPVVAPELYKQLKNYDGSKHTLAKNKSLWSRFVMRPIRAIKSGYINASKRYYSWLGRKTASVGKRLGKGLFGGLARRGVSVFNKMFERVDDPNTEAQISATMAASDQQTEVLSEILQELKDQKPKELRKGSWQEKLGRKKDTKDPTAATNAKDDQSNSLFSRGLKGLAGLLGFGKDDDDDGFGLRDAADLAEIGDAAGNARERARNRKGGKGGKGRGRLGRLGSRIAGSRIGQAVGSLGGRAIGAVAGTTGGMMLARAGVAVGGLIAGALSAPVLLTAAAVVGGAAVTYAAWNRLSDITGDFRELRFAQYGVESPVKKSFLDRITSGDLVSLGGDKIKILKLEALLEKHTTKDPSTPSLNIAAAGGREILEVMGIDPEDEAGVISFSRWLERRFKPIYLKWIAGLSQLGKSDIKINEVDDKLPDELKGDFLNLIRFGYGADSPYQVLDNPFEPDYPLVENAERVKYWFERLGKKFDKLRKPKDGESVKSEATGETSTVKDAGKTAIKVTANTAKDLVKSQAMSNEAKATLGTTSLAGAAVSSSSLSGTVINLNTRIGDNLTALQSIRMRAYGLQLLNKSQVRALLQLEAIYAKDLMVTADSVDYTGDEGQLLVEAGKLLGKDTTVGSADRPKLYNWLIERFAPAFRAYYGTAKGLSPSVDLKGLESKLNGADKVTVAMAVMGAVYRHDKTVWDALSIFDVSGPLDDLKRLANADLEWLKTNAEKDVVNTPTQKGSDQQGAKSSADKGGSFTDRIVGTIKDTWESTKETVSSSWDRAKEATGDTVASAKIAIGMGPEYGGDGQASGQRVMSGGNIGNVTKGNGGQWESIPYPQSSGSIKAAYPTLKAVSEMTGVPLSWLLVICGIESGFRYTVKAGTSSATGWFQFIDSTWDSVYAKYGPKYGCPPDPRKLRTERNDPRINALMGAEFIKANWEGLKKGLGRDNITDVDVYMAHFLGLGGALKFLRADSNAMGYRVFSKEYKSNMPIFFVNSKPSQPRTIGQIYQLFKDKIANFWKTTGKGYQTGDAASEQVPEPQTPGTVQNQEAIDKEIMESNLKADANDKDGIAANAKDAQQPTQSVSEMARNTSTLPGTSTTAPSPGSSSVSSTGSDSRAEVVDEQRQAQLAAAQAQNVRRTNEIKQDKKTSDMVNDIQTRQLNAVIEIRDLMRTMVEQNANRQNSNTPGASAPSGNDMRSRLSREQPAMDRPSAVNLR